MPNKLWNKNFTIITLGTVVSMLGNAVSGFAIALLVLDYQDSVFLYVLFMVAYQAPKIVMPLLAGPYLDRFSRCKVVYTLDFLSAGIYLFVFAILRFDLFNYPLLLIIALLIGSVDSIYQTAYDSLYPTLVTEGNFSKAYSVSSMIYPLAAFMVPVTAFCYEKIGLEPLFLFNAATFLIAAIFETQIKPPQQLYKKHSFSVSAFGKDFRDGISYIRGEKGLLVITAYFVVTMLCSSSQSILLPYFKSIDSLGVLTYTFVAGASVVGRLVGGFLQYKLHYPSNSKFTIALCVYVIITFLEGLFLYTPIPVMVALMFVSGLLSVNSYNIRISATQSYISDSYRGRFNGTFQMLCSAGTIVGTLIFGALADHFDTPAIVLGGYAVNFVAVFAIMFAGRRHVKLIYNREV